MQKLTVTSTFLIKSEEQAEYIRKLYDDLQALITCDTSTFESTLEKIENDSEKSKSVNPNYDFSSIIFKTEDEANEVLRVMREVISSYGIITVADFYETIGCTYRFQDHAFGWTDLSTATSAIVDDGYSLRLTTPRLL